MEFLQRKSQAQKSTLVGAQLKSFCEYRLYMISIVKPSNECPIAQETVFPSFHPRNYIEEARRQQASECFDLHEKLAVVDSISSLDCQNITLSNKKRRRVSRDCTRRDKTYETWVKIDGIDYEINNEENQGIYEVRLERMVAQLNVALIKWKRVMCCRLDLHTKLNDQSGEDIRRFMKSLNKRLKAKYKGFKHLGYCWSREVGSIEKRKHYHLMLMVDGNLVQSSGVITRIAKQAWEQYPGQTASWPKEVPFDYIERTNHPDHLEKLRDVVYRMSYLAKTKDKGFAPKGAKEFNCSRLAA